MDTVTKSTINNLLNKPKLNKPKFSSRFYVETVEPEGVFLISEKDSLWLSEHSTTNAFDFLSVLLKNLESPDEHLYQLLIPLIDGHHTVDEIVDAILPHLLSEKASNWDVIYAHAKVYYALMQMEQKGCIVESDDPLPPNLAIFCEYLNIEPKEAHRRLQTTQVAVRTFGSNLPSSQFKTTLESLHIQVSDEGDIEVVLTDDYLQESLDAFNQQVLHLSRPWMLVKPLGTMVWIGPIFRPGKTGCWECLAQRLRGNKPVEGFIQRRKDISTPLVPPLCSLLSTWQTALGMAATEVLKWILLGENKQLEGVLATYDTLSRETQNHLLVKRPQCPSCGKLLSEFEGKPLPLVLESRKKTFTADGGHRCYSPQETLKKYQHHISPITGVVRELRKVYQGENSLTHTYVAKHHFATMFDNLDALRQNLDGRSAGKGKTDQQAMELVERDSVALWWYNRIKRPRVDLDSFDEPYFQALKEYYRTIHRQLWVLDITADLNIPTFAAITRRSDRAWRTSKADRAVEDITLGFGAHFDPKLAIGRALTEVNQILPNVLSDDANGGTQYPPSSEPLAIDWWKTATLENQPYLAPDESVPPKVCTDYPQLWSDDLLEDVKTCQQIVEKQGMEMLVLDQTRSDIGLYVVKAIVPGMRHWWNRLGPGRLYDVPIKLGWWEESLKENQLNPFPMWM